MVRLLIYLCVLLGAVWFGVEVVNHPGYMLIVYQPWMMQLPLWFGCLTVILAIVVCCLLVSGLDRLHFSFYKIKNWFRFRREQQLFSKTQAGLCALIEGQPKSAERLLIAGINTATDPLINYLAAARAAQSLHEYERRDGYIQKAYQIAPDDELAIGITQAELEIEQHRYEQAVATLTHLLQRFRSPPRVLQLLQKVYVYLGDWQQLILLLPMMRKTKIFTPVEFSAFEKNIYYQSLLQSSARDMANLERIYGSFPKHIRKSPEVVLVYAQRMQPFPESHEQIQHLIQNILKNEWHGNLVEVYGTLAFDNLNRQLLVAESWLKMYGPQREVLLLLGRLCMKIQLWGKAKEYFEKSISVMPQAEMYFEYGKLLESLDDTEGALVQYRLGLKQLLPTKVNHSYPEPITI